MVIQYAFIRTDMASMTIGRSCAQAMHIANKMVSDLVELYNAAVQEMRRRNSPVPPAIAIWHLYQKWRAEADGFGTALVFGCTERELWQIVQTAQRVGLHANIVEDPEYWVQDGDSGHIVRDVVVGGYIFGKKGDISPLVSNLNLKLLGMD